MIPKTHHDRVRSEDRTANTIMNEARQAAVNRAIGSSFLDLDKEVAWNGGYVLNQLIVRRDGDGWQGLVKASRNGNDYVAYAGGGTYAEVIELIGEFAGRGCFTWLKDRYPPKRRWFK
jgi:hypothetical protein